MKKDNNDIRKSLRGLFETKRTETISLCMVIGLVIFMTAFNPKFLGAANLLNLFISMADIMIISAGIMFVLLLGSIDLSTGAICSFSAVLTATLVKTMGAGGIVAALLFGIAAGLINGLLVVYVRIPSFIATLATMSVWSSMALIVSHSASVAVGKDAGAVFDIFNWHVGIISSQLILGVIIVVICFIVASKMKLGKYIYAIGANETAARMCGAPVKRSKVIAFTICGFCSALLGILLVAKLKSASPYVGDDYNMLGIAAAVLGGISLSGGRGHGIWMILGCAIIAIVQNGISVIGVPAFWQQVVYGVIIMLAIIITSGKKSRLQIVK